MTVPTLRPALDHRRALAAEQAAFARLAATADPTTPVPACAPWTVEDLVRHLGGVHRWAAATVGLPADADVPDDEPFAAAQAAGDYPATATDLLAALADPRRPCPTLAGPGTVRWWARRQLHETFVHRIDLAEALGLVPEAGDDEVTAVDPAVAADCVAEVLDTMQPRQVRLGRMPEPAAGVRLTTPSGSWTLGPEPAVAEVTGSDLAVGRLLWRRIGPADPRLAVTGDLRAAARELGRRLTP